MNSYTETLFGIAKKHDCSAIEKKFSVLLDGEDKLAHLRKEFIFPTVNSPTSVESSNKVSFETRECIYFCGNSLGLQPKKTLEFTKMVLENWQRKGVECHFNGFLPAGSCEDFVDQSMSKLVGAYLDEVAVMNGLTVNLHLLLVSFYQPTSIRHKILLEAKAFPSDHYAIESQIKLHGFNPKDSMLFLEPRVGEDTWRHEDIIETIRKEGDKISLVLLPGVHYYSGQLFDMKTITQIAHEKGCMVGFDLAHAVGNVELYLHDWNVDFACWCTYKYLNSGPGAIGGAFMHRKHHGNNYNKFLGWWGHKFSSRFQMNNVMDMIPGMRGYRLSNTSPLLIACLRASLDIFEQTSMKEIREKSILLTGYLEMLLKHYFSKEKSSPYIDIITPSDHRQRGCQLSLVFSCPVTEIHEKLRNYGVMCDIRQPNVLRIAPAPLYNSFSDVYRFVEILRHLLK